MDWRLFVTVFITVFIAEVGDKTQFATMLYASKGESNKMTVFFGAAIALVLASLIAVLCGSLLSHYINPKYLSWIAGFGFITVGVWTIVKAVVS